MKKKTISVLGVSAFCESMAMMLRAGIRADEAIFLMSEESSSDGALSGAIRQASLLVSEGRSVSEALAGTALFPAYFIRMVDLGERKGQMEDVFFHLAGYYADQDDMARKFKNLVRYPAVMLVIIAAVLAVILTTVLPLFSGVYESMTGSLSASAYHYVYGAQLICWVALAVMLAAMVVLAIGLLMRRSEKGSALLAHVLERFPLTTGIAKGLGLYRLFVSLCISMSAGETQDAAMQDGIAMTHCGLLEDALGECAHRMDAGEGIAQAVYHAQLLEPVYGRMLLAGAQSGSLDAALGRMSRLLRGEVSNQVDKLVNLLDPILSGVLMASVGLSLLSVMLPLVGMVSAIG